LFFHWAKNGVGAGENDCLLAPGPSLYLENHPSRLVLICPCLNPSSSPTQGIFWMPEMNPKVPPPPFPPLRPFILFTPLLYSGQPLPSFCTPSPSFFTLILCTPPFHSAHPSPSFCKHLSFILYPPSSLNANRVLPCPPQQRRLAKREAERQSELKTAARYGGCCVFGGWAGGRGRRRARRRPPGAPPQHCDGLKFAAGFGFEGLKVGKKIYARVSQGRQSNIRGSSGEYCQGRRKFQGCGITFSRPSL
jgi:hypothetical protein